MNEFYTAITDRLNFHSVNIYDKFLIRRETELSSIPERHSDTETLLPGSPDFSGRFRSGNILLEMCYTVFKRNF